jgi:hypothetical protein
MSKLLRNNLKIRLKILFLLYSLEDKRKQGLFSKNMIASLTSQIDDTRDLKR